LNSGVNERRGRGFFPMLSMIGHPSGGEPLMVDVRQSGSGSVGEISGMRATVTRACMTCAVDHGFGRSAGSSVGTGAGGTAPTMAG
jgi:hypothetical protein